MKFRNALLAATMMALPLAAAHAQPVSGLYIGGAVGWNYLDSLQAKNVSAQSNLYGGIPVPNKGLNYGSGLVTLGSVGWGFGNGLRLELEGNYRGNYHGQNGSTPSFSSVTSVTGGGEEKAGAMVNALYDFTDAFGPGLSPYVGAGVGWAYVRQTNIQAAGLIPAGLPAAGQPYLFRFNNGQNAFAYQAILGLSYALPSVPGLALTTEFRYYGLGGDTTYKGQFFAPKLATGARVQVGNENNYGILFGVRYAFNAAPPPPPPMAPPAPRAEAARTYLVFFDWDRADLTDRARQIIAEAAQATTRVQVTRIEVSGHTDTTGTAKYNQGLSVRRAQNVAAELVRLGVPQSAITTQGFGFSRPLVATGPNVREPQNRRVEIVLK